MTLNGRIQLDVWTYPDTSPGVNGFETGDNDIAPADRVGIRRLRFGAYGDIYETMQYRIDVELADADRVEPRDVFIGFKELPLLQTVLIGHQKRPLGLDQWNSSNFNVFMERPFMDECSIRVRVDWAIQSWSHTEDKSWNWQYGAFESSRVQSKRFLHEQPLAGTSRRTVGQHAVVRRELGRSRLRPLGGFGHLGRHRWRRHSTPNYANSGLSTGRFRSRPEARTVQFLDRHRPDSRRGQLQPARRGRRREPWPYAIRRRIHE